MKRLTGWRCALAAAMIAVTLGACGGSGGSGGSAGVTASDPPANPAALASVAGNVADATTGEPLAGVVVSIGAASATTDADGAYRIASVPVGSNIVARFAKALYADSLTTFDLAEGLSGNGDRRMSRVGVRAEVDAGAGAAVSVPGSTAQVQLPASGLVNVATGAAVSGKVTVALTVIDPGADPLNMPGSYRAQGEEAPLQSLGAIQVELRDALTGARLNLAGGSGATIRIPLPSGAKGGPDTIPLYYLDEHSGLWVREGSAQLQGVAPRQYYEGRVAHFSYWNADQTTQTIFIHGCVRDGSGKALSTSVSAAGLDYAGRSVARSGGAGEFRVAARINSLVVLTATIGLDKVTLTATTGATDLTLPVCMTANAGPPTIAVQPADQTLGPDGFAWLDVIADGAERYQWLRNGAPVGASRYLLIWLGGAGAGDYTVSVSNRFGAVVSRTATVTVRAPSAAPLISVQPVSASAPEAGSASFSVEAQGEGMSYQWLRDGVDIAGAGGPALALAGVTAADSGSRFSCRVSNARGAVLSAAATLTVSALAAPSITRQPANASVTLGQQASFAVGANGSAPLSYQWLRNGAAVAGANAATYVTPAVTSGDNGALYSIRVSNKSGSVTSDSATLSVAGPDSAGGRWLPFVYGPVVADSVAMGVLPAEGGKGLPMIAAGAGGFLQTYQTTARDGGRDYALAYWDNARIVSRALRNDSGLAGAVIHSTLTQASLCPYDAARDLGGNDARDLARSWATFHQAGPDGLCNTQDDAYVAVAMSMGADEPPLALTGAPLLAVHAADGTLTGWLMRSGSQLLRTDPDFSHARVLLTLPAVDAVFRRGMDVGAGVALLESGRGLYAIDPNAAGAAATTFIAAMTSKESARFLDSEDGQSIYLAITDNQAMTTRLLRYAVGQKTSAVLGTYPGWLYQMEQTATRVVLVLSAGISSVPKTGGAATVIAPFVVSISSAISGERLWFETRGSVQSVNSDGGGQLTIAAAQLAGCMRKPMVTSAADLCDAQIIIEGNTVRAYDAATGAVRLTYGDVSATPFGRQRRPALMPFSYGWGGGVVLSLVFYDTNSGAGAGYLSFYLKGGGGVSLIEVP